jgi:hypothetical protein
MTIERYSGEGARGPQFLAAEENVPVSAQSIENLKVEWKDEEVLVKYMLMVRPEVGDVPLGSRVTIDYDVLRVIKTIPIPDWFRPDHVELMCTSWGSQ